MTENGDIIASAVTGPSNPWILGIGEKEDGFVVASFRLYELILDCMDQVEKNDKSLLSRSTNNTEYTLEAVVNDKIIFNFSTSKILNWLNLYKIILQTKLKNNSKHSKYYQN